jgi:cold shock CspA family protein
VSEGTLRLLSEETDYGPIRPDDGSRNLFVRSADIVNGEGDEVRYEVNQGRNGMRATNVSRRRRYSWRDDCRERLEGKEARHEYYAGL